MAGAHDLYDKAATHRALKSHLEAARPARGKLHLSSECIVCINTHTRLRSCKIPAWSRVLLGFLEAHAVCRFC